MAYAPTLSPNPSPPPRCWPLGPARPFQLSAPPPHQDPPPSRHSSSAPARTRLPFSPDSLQTQTKALLPSVDPSSSRVRGVPVNLLCREPAPALLPSRHSLAGLASLHSETDSPAAAEIKDPAAGGPAPPRPIRKWPRVAPRPVPSSGVRGPAANHAQAGTRAPGPRPFQAPGGARASYWPGGGGTKALLGRWNQPSP